MKICSIGAQNFRTLENFNLNLKPTYCAISGKNDSGKSAIVRIIQFFFSGSDDDSFYPPNRHEISFSRDATQWSSTDEIEVSIEVELDRVDDSEVFFVVNTFSEKKITGATTTVRLSHKFKKGGSGTLACKVGDEDIEGQNASEILKKFRSASNLFVHNSTNISRNYYFGGESFIEVLNSYFSADDRKRISEAEKRLQTQVKRAARQHKEELEKLLGKLTDKYHVELSTIDRGRSSSFPLQLKLTDKNVEVKLDDWGAGTQNRTRVLMSVLEAIRMRSSATEEDRSTPVFLVEEPESFLHPSAQAEFGQVLNGLAEELHIQIIATTHSPYMLNQNDPSANVLLERKIYRNSPRETIVRDISGDDWMLPFSDNLGIIPSEFKSWKSVFAAHTGKVILVEGDIDKEYFEIIKENYPSIYYLDGEIEVVPYGGKDALKNTSVLQFMINKFGRVFVTFDLDAKDDVRAALGRIGLVEGKDFCAIGIAGAGTDCIEGLLPPIIKKSVYAARLDLVTALGSQDSKARNSAKNELKRALLEEFKSSLPAEKELSHFKSLFLSISKAFK